jgi:hypothetical protein
MQIFLGLGLALCLSLFSAQASASNEVVQQLKKDIIDLAYSFEGQADPDLSKQAALEEKIDELLNYIPNLTMTEKAIRAIGSWRQIWGPYAFDDSQTVPDRMDVKNIYQVISPDGYYYNFGQYKFRTGVVRSFVRGIYEIQEDRIEVEFNGNGIILGQRQTPMYQLVDALENREIRAIRFPDFVPPIGIRGALIEVYADEDIRINYGVIGSDISKPALFVMEPAGK